MIDISILEDNITSDANYKKFYTDLFGKDLEFLPGYKSGVFMSLMLLPNHIRSAIILRHFENRTYKEIGKILNVSGTIAATYIKHKGVRMLRHPKRSRYLIRYIKAQNG